MAEERVVGIDLGTTNSLVAYMQGGTPTVIPGEDGDRLVPSVVAWTDDGVAVGNAARTTLLSDAASAVYSAKRLMGRDIEDVQDELKLFPFKLADGLKAGEVLKVSVGGLLLTPPEISAYVERMWNGRVSGGHRWLERPDHHVGCQPAGRFRGRHTQTAPGRDGRAAAI